MERNAGTLPGSLLRRVFWLPAACLVAVELYARDFDGRGAWATAPLFLLPLILSLAIGVAGARDAWFEAGEGGPRPTTLLFLVLALAPLGWLLVRRYLV